MQAGLLYKIIWDDGEEMILEYIRSERGFYLFKDKAGELQVARISSVKIQEVESE